MSEKPTDVPHMDEARANLMAAIRATGGFATAGLKPVDEHRVASKKIDEKCRSTSRDRKAHV